MWGCGAGNRLWSSAELRARLQGPVCSAASILRGKPGNVSVDPEDARPDRTPRGRPTGPDPADAGAVTTSGDATMAMSSHWLVFPFYLFPVFLKNENALLA